MRALRLFAGLLSLSLLAGCASLLERTYSTSEPHSSRFWESEAAGTLRAENYQDIVNDLLLLIDRHTENATLRLYNFESDLSVADALEQAATEIQQETPMGAYAVEYITTVSQSQRGYYEAAVRISYRRTLEQLQSVVNATSPEAFYSLLGAALADGKTELAVRIGYWGTDGQVQVENTMALLREEWELEETAPWLVNYYPSAEAPGLVEFLLDPPEQAGLPEEGESSSSGASSTGAQAELDEGQKELEEGAVLEEPYEGGEEGSGAPEKSLEENLEQTA